MPCLCDLAMFCAPHDPTPPPCDHFETDPRFAPFCMGCNHAEKCHCNGGVNNSSVTRAFQIANNTQDQRA